MKKKSISLALGTAFVAGAALSPAVHAADNPFGMQKLDSGYQLAQAKAEDKKTDGKCGEGKCGAVEKKTTAKKTTAKKTTEKSVDGKCGEGKCGAAAMPVAKADDKKKDGACGGAKTKDGSCGAKK